MKNIIAVILGGGSGQRLYPLTKVRSKPAVPIGGKYRLIDIPISNCLNSGLDHIYVLTQFNTASLHQHIKRTYIFDTFSGGYVDILAAELTAENANWYQGTADAVRQQLRHIRHGRVDTVIILSGDHLYRMDYRSFLKTHHDNDADVTIAVKPVGKSKASGFGILKMDADGHITDFCEKPQTEEQLNYLKLDPSKVTVPGCEYMASMGIYIFKPSVLSKLLQKNLADDFGRDIIPHAIEKDHVHGHEFSGYWEDIGTIESFYNANLSLTDPEPSFQFYNPDAPIYTHPRYLAGAMIEKCMMERVLIGEGSEIVDSKITRSVIGIRSIVSSGAQIRNTIVMGSDYYESEEEIKQNKTLKRPNIGIGSNTIIDKAIIDKNARIGNNVRILNEKGTQEEEHKHYIIRDGIVVIPKNAIIPSGTVI